MLNTNKVRQIQQDVLNINKSQFKIITTQNTPKLFKQQSQNKLWRYFSSLPSFSKFFQVFQIFKFCQSRLCLLVSSFYRYSFQIISFLPIPAIRYFANPGDIVVANPGCYLPTPAMCVMTAQPAMCVNPTVYVLVLMS